MPTLMLIDGNSLTYRAFFALPSDMATASGQVTNAVFGFTSMFINLVRDHKPDAIAVAFDRRYGALKRLGATALPVWGIIAGKSMAVVTVVFLQAILLGAIGFALGWRPHPVGLLLGAQVIALGTATFVALGLLLGGTLKAEVVLALANLLWFVLAGLGALTLETQAIPAAVRWVARLTPSGALTEALSQAMTLSVDWFGVAVLAVWGGIGALGALRWFKFS